METLYVFGQPKRYVVTNTDKIILVTHDIKFAEQIANSINRLDEPKKYYVRLR